MSDTLSRELEQRAAAAMGRIAEIRFEDPEIETMFRYAADGGRRLRPALVTLGAELVGGRAEQVVDAAAAVELLHKFTLVHDDIIDEDAYRRGRKTFHTVFGADRGIIMGDLLIGKAQELMFGLERTHAADVVLRCTKILGRTLRALCVGELQDCLTEQQSSVSLETYSAMIAGKTSSLMEGALELGAVLGGASDELVERLGACGRALGQAFQMRNDLNDTMAATVNGGRKRGSELLRNKKTCLVVMLRELGRPEDLRLLDELSALRTQEVVDEERAADLAEQVFAAFEQSGALAACRTLIAEHVAVLRRTLEVCVDGPAKQVLAALGAYVEDDAYWQVEAAPRVPSMADLAACARPFYAQNRAAHDWAHIERVLANAREIAATEPGVDHDVLHAMVVLHDLVRYEDHREADSVRDTLEHAERIMRELGFSETFAERVKHGIVSHTIHGTERLVPSSLEAKILFDADKLDGTGTIGAARWLMVSANKNLALAFAAEKYLSTIARETQRPSPLFTSAGNRILRRRLAQGTAFFEDLLAQLNGHPAPLNGHAASALAEVQSQPS